VEDTVPPGWTVANVSHQGELDAVHGQLKWGPFVDSQARQLVYEVVAPASSDGGVSFAGSISVDGVSRMVTGPRESLPTCRLAGLRSLGADRLLLNIQGLQDAAFEVEASFDLERWFPLETVRPINGQIEIHDPDHRRLPRRFYRLQWVGK